MMPQFPLERHQEESIWQHPWHQLLHHKHWQWKTFWRVTDWPTFVPLLPTAWAEASALHAEDVFSTNSLTAHIFTIGSPSHKRLRTRPANGLYLQSPKLLERIDVISSHYGPSKAPGTKSLKFPNERFVYRFLVCRLFSTKYLQILIVVLDTENTKDL